MAERTAPRVFISYSRTSAEYQRRVVDLAKQLMGNGVDVIIDVWDLRPGHDKYEFMERCVADESIERVLILCDRRYAERADGREGGVGDETVAITPKVYGRTEQEKFIPVVMERDENGKAFLPAYLGSRMYVDLSGDESGRQYKELLRFIYDKPEFVKPKLGQPPSWLDSKGSLGTTIAPKDAAKVAVRNFPEYSWAELKSIANEIAVVSDYDSATRAVRNYDGALRVAHHYGLVDDNLMLSGDAKLVLLNDRSRAFVRIAGFCHDDRADGNGKAGITFEFKNVPKTFRMKPKWSNSGGWEKSEMRSWLKDNFCKQLPPELRSSIAKVRKCTNNRGGDAEGDTSVVTVTEDELWLFSLSEVFGSLSSQADSDLKYPAVYDAEGIQYQLYYDQGVSTSSCTFCAKDGKDGEPTWWLRSPVSNHSVRFHYVQPDGSCGCFHASYKRGVSPGFCF